MGDDPPKKKSLMAQAAEQFNAQFLEKFLELCDRDTPVVAQSARKAGRTDRMLRIAAKLAIESRQPVYIVASNELFARELKHRILTHTPEEHRDTVVRNIRCISMTSSKIDWPSRRIRGSPFPVFFDHHAIEVRLRYENHISYRGKPDPPEQEPPRRLKWPN